jgi:glycosyltransferase involved in cell wall biosynthesis
MKILILSQYYPPEVGAPQSRLSDTARILKSEGCEIFVLTALPNYPTGKLFKGYGKFFHRENIDGIQIIRCFIFPTKSTKILPRLVNYFSFVLSSLFFGLMTIPKVDIIITESPPLFLGISGFFLSKIKSARCIFNVSDLWPYSAVKLGVIHKGMSLKLSYWLESFCYKNAYAVTGQSREIIDDVSERFPDVKTYHYSNGVDVTRFSPQFSSKEIRDRLIGGRNFLAVYAGLHGIAQGLDQIIEACDRLSETDIQMVFFGDGPEKKNLCKKAIEKNLQNIEFHDPVDSRIIPAILASSDLIFIPLKIQIKGAVPSKIYEALASGVPIIAIVKGEAADIVKKSRAGVVVSPGNIDALVSAIQKIRNDKEYQQKLSEHGRSFAEKNYNRYEIAKKFLDFLKKDLTIE